MHESFNLFSHPNSTNTKLWYFDIYTTKLVTCIYKNKNYELNLYFVNKYEDMVVVFVILIFFNHDRI